ncbi:MAG: GNAT family N-acetyltransferase [Gammaproteobacteria bacterium]|nr:GNAT family N-acetyltransferase [Gammaproteobacteria bacterium]
MGYVLTVKGNNQPRLDVQLRGMFELRNKVFKERLKWQVNSNDGLEQDIFDQLLPVYMIVTDPESQVEGCWRLLPTTSNYMLRDVFPQLLRGEKYPVSQDVWEISRFAVMPPDGAENGQTILRSVTLEILRRGYEFAIANDITHYVAVMGVAMERFLGRTVGVPMRRFGDGRAQYVGDVLSVACWIDINADLYKALYIRNTTSSRSRGAPNRHITKGQGRPLITSKER